MKIGILTLPISENYGGILQAVALYRLLHSQGHDIILINKKFYPKKVLWKKIITTVLLKIPFHDFKEIKTNDKLHKEKLERTKFHRPFIEKEIFNNENIPSRQDVIEQLIPYVKDELKKGTRLNQIMRHTLGLFHGQTGASYWKRYLSENMCVRDADVQKIDHIMDKIKYNNIDTSVGQSA